jgi:hypothetical protein
MDFIPSPIPVPFSFGHFANIELNGSPGPEDFGRLRPNRHQRQPIDGNTKMAHRICE